MQIWGICARYTTRDKPVPPKPKRTVLLRCGKRVLITVIGNLRIRTVWPEPGRMVTRTEVIA